VIEGDPWWRCRDGVSKASQVREVLEDRLRHDKPLFPVGSYTQEPFLPKHLLYRITLQDIHIHDRYILFHLTFILHFSLHCRTTT
jgi:hypothetical protein